MTDLLKFVTDAHGGLDRNQLKTLKAHVSVTGAIWHVKGKLDVVKDIQIELPIHGQYLVTHLFGQSKRFVFTQQQVAVGDERGNLIEKRGDPRRAFEGHNQKTSWDDLHVAYFDSYALWTYLTIPFLYTYPGFVTEELSPWQENGEVWRPLKAIFPDNIASHTRQQISYFGEDGLLRRHEYVVDIMGKARGLNYAYDYRKVDGIMVPVTRRVVAFDDNKRKIPEPVPVAIDIHEIAFRSLAQNIDKKLSMFVGPTKYAVGCPKDHFFAAQSAKQPSPLLGPPREFCSRYGECERPCASNF